MKQDQTYRVGIIGLGPVGMMLAVYLQEAGCEVIIYDHNRVKIDQIRQDGIHLHNVVEKHERFSHICTSLREIKDAEPDMLIIALKTYQAASIIDDLEIFDTEGMTFVSAQNGIDSEYILANAFGESKTLRMVINFAGNLTAPNKVKVTFFNPPNYLASVDDQSREQADLLAGWMNSRGLDTKVIHSFELIKRTWEKTILNSSLSALCGIGKMTIKEVMEQPDTLQLIEQVIQEAVEVAAAEKIIFEDDFIRKCMRYLKKAGAHFPSLAVDLMNNRQTEIDYLNGKIVEYGRKHYVRTSLNLVFTNIVKAMTSKSILSQMVLPGTMVPVSMLLDRKRSKHEEACFLGIDLGSSYTKFTVIDGDDNILFQTTLKTFSREKVALQHVMEAIHNQFDIRMRCATGYGRKNFPEADLAKTEINCAAMGVSRYQSGEKNIIDIGGEDIKIIRCDANDQIENFYLNDKCAAGTGSFVTEVAERAGISVSDMSDLAAKSEYSSELNSFCTVFAKTEIMKWIFEGIAIEDIARGIYLSIINRIAKMRIDPDMPVVIIGGLIGHHPYLRNLLEKRTGQPVLILEKPQHIVSYGAALIAKEKYMRESPKENMQEKTSIPS